MKKWFFIFLIFPFFSHAQHRILLKGSVFDGVTFFPISNANIYNFNTKQYSFTDKDGFFNILVAKGDSLIVSKPIYKQNISVITQNIIDNKTLDIAIFFKTIALKEVIIYALPPTYEKFKKDFVNVHLKDINKTIEGTSLTQEDRVNADYSSEYGVNVLNVLPKGFSSPISYLYDKYSKKKKLERLYSELIDNKEEADNLPLKYNRDLVSALTGLVDDDLLNFMTFCRFSYYDLIRWSPEYIISQVKKKFDDYQYYKALEYK